MKRKPILIAFSIIVAAVLVVFPHFGSKVLLHYTMWALAGIMLALGTNVFMGYCRMMNFGVGGWFAIGGYGVGLLETYLHLNFGLALLSSLVFSALVTLILCLALLRMRHYVLALGTFAFSLVVYKAVASGFESITGGEDGIMIPKLMLLGRPMGTTFYYYAMLVAAVISFLIVYHILHSRVGRAMRAIAQDEMLARAMGVNVNKYLFLALLINGLIATLAGALYIKWNGWVSPEYFGVHTSTIAVVALVVGGLGSPAGAVIGAMVVFVVPQLLIAFEKWHPIMYGLIIGVTLRFAQDGLVGVFRRVQQQLAAATQRG